MSYDYIFCDLDGPILEGVERHYWVYCTIVEKFGGEPLPRGLYWEMKRAMVKRDVVLKQSNFRGSYRDFETSWLEMIESKAALDRDLLKPRIFEALGLLQQQCKKLWLVSLRQTVASIEYELARFGIAQFFDRVVECRMGSPNAKYQALESLGVVDGLFIGDTEEDLATARLLGIPFLGISNGLRRLDLLAPPRWVNDLDELLPGGRCFGLLSDMKGRGPA